MDRLEALAMVDRPKLGDQVPISVFRIFRQFTAMHGEDLIGERGIRTVFTHAGRELGLEVGKSLMTPELDDYLERVFEYVSDAKIGVLSAVEVSDERIILRLDECITCAGMPNLGKKICHFEVGIVSGIVQAFVGKPVHGFESKCNVNGDDCCEVTVDLAYLSKFFD